MKWLREPIQRQSTGAGAGSDERAILKNLKRTSDQRMPIEDLHGSDDKLNEQLKGLEGASLQPKCLEDLDSLIPQISHPRDDEISDRVRATESRIKRRSSRGFARYLVAICVGVAGTLAWQSYGEAIKQMMAISAPELGWSPEAKQMIASWVQQLGWTKPPTGPENTAVQLSVPKMQQAASPSQAGSETISNATSAPSLDQQQLRQMEADIVAVQQTVEQRLAAVRGSVEQLAVGQDQVLREIAKLHEEILRKIPASSPQLPAAPARKPIPAPASSSRAPIPPPSSREPTSLQLPPHS
jgi:hypothetical protein